MKKIDLLKTILGLITLIFIVLPVNEIHAQEPEYAEWGKIALEEMAAQYPDLNVVNYEYQGKVFISEERSQYNFEFILETEDGQERIIHAYVLVNPNVDQLIDVYFDEMQELT